MEGGWKNEGLEHNIENEGGDRAAITRLVDEGISNPNSNSKTKSEVL